MATDKKSGCAVCGIRKRAEARPRSLFGFLWKIHSYICPGWRSYQRSLAKRNEPSSD